MRAERDVEGEAGAEAQVGLQHVRLGWERVHLTTGDAGDCDGMFCLFMLGKRGLE